MRLTRTSLFCLLLAGGCRVPTQSDDPIATGPSISVAAIGNWAYVTSMAGKRYYPGTVVDAAGLIYALGGYNGRGAISGSGGTALTTVERYNPATNSWTARASMQFPHQGGAYAIGTNGRIYAFGGGSAAQPQRVEAYDPATNTWTSVSPMPTPRSHFAAATAPDGKIWLLGGYSAGAHLNRVEVFDPATNSWYSGPPLLTPRSRLTATTGADGRIYAIGGTDGIRALNTVEQLNPSTLTWTAVAPLSVSRMDAAATATTTGQIYVIGGLNYGTTLSAVAEFFDPPANTWVAEPNLLTGRRLLGAATSGGRIYAVGGADHRDSALATVEVLTPTEVNTVSILVTTGSTINPNVPDTVEVGVIASAANPASRYENSGAHFAGAPQIRAFNDDVNNDGRNDRVYWFLTTAMTLPIGTTQACISGTTNQDEYFRGCSSITLSATGRVWSAIASMSTPRFAPAVVTGNDGRIYAFGGVDANGTVLSSGEAYNPTTNTWGAVASMPAARYGQAAAKGTDGRLYVFGGTDGVNPVSSVYQYNTITNTWATRTSMANTRDFPAAALGSDGRIYVFGGADDDATQVVFNTNEAYNTSTNTWSAIANLGARRYELAAATGSDARLYVFGGWNSLGATQPLNTSASYSVSGNSWTNETNMPARLAGMGAATLGSAVVTVGGYDDTVVYNTVYQYTLSSNTWVALPGMTSDRAYLGVAAGLDGKIYAVGGYDGQDYLATAEVFATQTSSGIPLQPLN